MAVAVTYPGVYSSIVSSPNPPTAGIATSVTLLVGRAAIGPVLQPTPIFSYQDYIRQFGGLGEDFPLSYAAYHFFNNGGGEAIIVRSFKTRNAEISVGEAQVLSGTGYVTVPASGANPFVVQKVAGGGTLAVTLTQSTSQNLDAASGYLYDITVTQTPAEGDATSETLINVRSQDTMTSGTTFADALANSTLLVAPTNSAGVPLASIDPSVPTGSTGISGVFVANNAATIPVGNAAVPLDTAYVLMNSAATSPFLVAAAPGAAYNGLAVTLSLSAVQPSNATDTAFLYDMKISLTVGGGQPMNEQFTGIQSATGMSAGQSFAQAVSQSALVVQPVDASGKPLAPPAFTAKISSPIVAVTKTEGLDSLALDAADYSDALGAVPSSMLYNIVVLPPDDPDTWDRLGAAVYQGVAQQVVDANAFLIVDPLQSWEGLADSGQVSNINLSSYPALSENQSESAAVFFPRINAPDPLSSTGAVQTFYPSAFMAGAFAQMDSNVGVWAAAAGLSSPINGAVGLTVELNDPNNGLLYVQGINCLRTFNIGGTVPWGARTLRGAPALADQYNVIPVRRLALYIAQWVNENTRWAVFQPNDQTLWSALTAQVTTFMTGIWKRGGLFGTSASQAFFVNCNATTTTQDDINNGVVNLNIGFAPVRPAEFVVITIQQSYSTGTAS